MANSLLCNSFILGGLSGLIGMIVLHFHLKNQENTYYDEKIYIKMFILVSILSCLSVFVSQNCSDLKVQKYISGGGVNIHTGSPSF